jgi:hypothetical protein
MEQVIKPIGRLIAAAAAVFVGVIVIYLASVFGIYLLAWIVQLLEKIF